VAKKKAARKKVARKRAAKRAAAVPVKKRIESYAHADKQRMNNPPVGLVTPDTDPVEEPRKTYQYDPHLDPQLVWAGKAERTSFDVPTVSLHVHERIDPKTIIAAVRTNGDRVVSGAEAPGGAAAPKQLSLFEAREENPPLRDAIDFYNHAKPLGWKNRLIAGDSLLVMSSLLEKEGMAGSVQMIYIDPPYGIRYGSNFQPFVNRRDVKDGKDEDLTQEPEMVKAFRDTWELGIHSYLTYLRDRLLLAKELLTESGSVFVQISDENLHHVREIMDEVFGPQNYCSVISFLKTTGASSPTAKTNVVASVSDYILWYARDFQSVKYRQLFAERSAEDDYNLRWIEAPGGARYRVKSIEEINKAIDAGGRLFRPNPLTSQTPGLTTQFVFRFKGVDFSPGSRGWSTHAGGMQRLQSANRLMAIGNTLSFVRYLNDFPVKPINNFWMDTRQSGFGEQKSYVVQTSRRVLERCMLMTTDPGDLVFDPTCGSGTTAYVAEQWGRRWITCDTSRVAVTLAKQRLLTALFDYYTLARPAEGVAGGFVCKTVPHVTLKSIANNPDIREGMSRAEIDAAIAKHADQEVLHDKPDIDSSKARVTGPFTVEAVPAAAGGVPEVAAIGSAGPGDEAAGARGSDHVTPDASIARSGETLRQTEWRDELARTGVRGKGGAKIGFARLEALPGARWLHAIGETDDGGPRSAPKSVVVSFGPAYAPLEQRQVEMAWEEARELKVSPDILLFAAFHFDPEAAKDIDTLAADKSGMLFLRSQMNTDLLTDDLKKKRSSNESFWLIGQPDVELQKITTGESKGLWQVVVHGFDYYNPVSGEIESGDTRKIAMWLLDTNYDGRSLYPRQVFFPMSGEKDGWSRLAKNLRAEIDDDLIEAYRGTESLPFAPGPYGRAAVKIVDDRGIESLKIVEFPRP
jgi:adenine-specific DNA-methyltransferase